MIYKRFFASVQAPHTGDGIIQSTRGALPAGPPSGGRGRLSDPAAPRGRAAAGRGRAVAGADLHIV